MFVLPEIISNIFPFLGEPGTRELTYKCSFLVWLFACVFQYVGFSMHTSYGTVFGKEYGRQNFLQAVIKYVCYALSFASMLVFLFLWVTDFLTNFFGGISFLHIICLAVGSAVYIFLYFAGVKRNKKSSVMFDKKYEKEINVILLDNPVFCEIINVFNKSNDIKAARIYNDGVAFFLTNIPKASSETDDLSNLISGSQAKQYIKDRVDEWLSLYGTVKKSYGDIVIKYEDYNFSTSDSAMADIAKHISRFVNKPIVVSCCQKSWVFDKTEYYEGGYSIHGNQITPKVSSKKLYEIKDAIAYYGVEVLDSITSRTTDSYGVSAKTEKVPQNRW